MKRSQFIAVIILLLMLCGVLWCLSSPAFLCDNITPMDELISVEYSSTQIKEMIEKIDSRSYTARQFKRDFKIECLRKASGGYYAIFRQDDGKHVFVYLREDLTPVENSAMIIERFRTKAEFESFLSTPRIKSDVIQFDSSTLFPFSGTNGTLHHMIEGVGIVLYDSGTPFYEAPVCGFEFYGNEELREYDEAFLLEIDRVN